MNIQTDLINCFVNKIDTDEKYQVIGVFYDGHHDVRFLLLNEQNEFCEESAKRFKYTNEVPENTIHAESQLEKTLLTENK